MFSLDVPVLSPYFWTFCDPNILVIILLSGRVDVFEPSSLDETKQAKGTMVLKAKNGIKTQFKMLHVSSNIDFFFYTVNKAMTFNIQRSTGI